MINSCSFGYVLCVCVCVTQETKDKHYIIHELTKVNNISPRALDHTFWETTTRESGKKQDKTRDARLEFNNK